MPTWIVLAGLILNAHAFEKSRVLDAHGAGNLVDGPSGFTQTLVAKPAYADIERDLNALASRHADKAQVVNYGKTVGGKNLTLMRVARGDIRVAARPAVQISGVIHGNEYLGIEDKLIAHFLDHMDLMPGFRNFLAKGGVLYHIPIVNPDGYTRSRRLNDNGSDLNRDFDLLPRNDFRFTQPETRFLASYLEDDMTKVGAKLKVTLDYHCCVPAMITPWTYVDAQPEPADRATFTALGNMQRSVLGYEYGNAKQTVGYLAEGSSIDYFYAKYGTLALAIEGKWFGEVGELNKHAAFWDRIFQELADKS